VAAKRGKVHGLPEGPLKALTTALEHKKAQVRARVEHPYHVLT
jgi:IS5 family transposase